MVKTSQDIIGFITKPKVGEINTGIATAEDSIILSHNFLVMADSHRIYEILSPLWQTIELTKELTDRIISNVNDFWHEKESFFEFKDVLITPENQELLKKLLKRKINQNLKYFIVKLRYCTKK